ncbi:DUF4012 domain-containing protein [Patescibacteria group bacterium]|nr:DUF4012 domain-containing protein [Patescibacteria group bacterium]
MSQLKTHLLAEDPSVVLIGNSTMLRSQVIKMLQNQSLRVIVVEIEEILEGKTNLEIFNNIYKTIWVHEHDEHLSENYLDILSIVKEIKVPVVVVANLISNLIDSSSDLLQGWKERSQKQTQFIVDCNYYLPKASFIFGQDVVSKDLLGTSLEFAVQNIQKGVIVDPNIEVGVISSELFIENLKEYLFKPGKQSSVLIKGEDVSSGLAINLLKRLYDLYHNTNLEIIVDSIKTNDLIPFSVKEKTIHSDFKTVIAKIVKSLNSPQEIKKAGPIKKPNEKLKFEERIEPVARQKFETKSVVLSSPKIDVDNEIQRIFKTTRTENKVDRIRKIAKDTKKITKRSGRKKIFFIGGVGAAGAAIGIIVLSLIFYVSQSILRKELAAFISRGIVDQEMVFIEDGGLKRITDFVSLQVDGYGSIIETNLILDASSMVEISEDLQSIPQMLLEVNEASKNLFLQVMAGDNNKTSELAQILDDKAQLAYENLSGIQASFSLIDFNIKSENREVIIADYENKIKEIRSGIAIEQQLKPIIASLTGETSKKTYAVILQNNQELRPTGGFIQAVALLNFDQGVLVSHDVYSVYELDAKLPGSIIPPPDIVNYLGEEKWYLRDSNWNPDFPTTSAQIGWFINKSIGVDIDGVVAINLFSTRDLFEVLGPVDLPKYNEVITHKNLLERMEFHSEVVLIDSPDSIDYSVAIFEKLIEKIANINRDKVPSFLSALENSILDNQISISVTEKSDQLVLHSLGWTGGLVKPNCPTQLSLVDCQVDAFSQVEANIGINKANYYLDRLIVHKIIVDREKAIHMREITFSNNAKSNSWPKGTYKSYQRFYIDKDATIDKILINGSALIEEQISQKEVNGFKEIGIRVDVPIQTQVVVELNYATPHDFMNGFSYVFFNKKQAGTSGDSLKVSFEYADDIEPVLIAPAAEVFDKIITFDSGFENSLFSVEFQ